MLPVEGTCWLFINKSETAVAATKQTAMCNTAVTVVVVACTKSHSHWTSSNVEPLLY